MYTPELERNKEREFKKYPGTKEIDNPYQIYEKKSIFYGHNKNISQNIMIVGSLRKKVRINNQKFFKEDDYSPLEIVKVKQPIDEILALNNSKDLLSFYLGYSISTIKNDVNKRIRNLVEMSEDDDSVNNALIESLKGLIAFLILSQDFKKPSITISDEGLFNLTWEKSHNELIIIQFENYKKVSFVIFRESDIPDDRIINRGTSDYLTLYNDINRLRLKYITSD